MSRFGFLAIALQICNDISLAVMQLVAVSSATDKPILDDIAFDKSIDCTMFSNLESFLNQWTVDKAVSLRVVNSGVSVFWIVRDRLA